MLKDWAEQGRAAGRRNAAEPGGHAYRGDGRRGCDVLLAGKVRCGAGRALHPDTETPEGTDMQSEIKYPDVHVQLVGNDGNAFAIMGAVSRALKRAGVPSEEVDQYTAESMAGDYDDLLRVAGEWVTVS